MGMRLETEEIDTLIDALTAWEAKDFGGELMIGLLGAMFNDKKDPEAKARFEEEERKRKEKADQEAKRELRLLED